MSSPALPAGNEPAPRDPHYKWVALSNTTLGMLAAAVNGSILLISLPAIFRGIHLKPLEPSNVNWASNITFGIGLILVLIGITEGIQPYGSHAMAWTSPEVVTLLAVGLTLLVTFLVIESRVA